MVSSPARVTPTDSELSAVAPGMAQASFWAVISFTISSTEGMIVRIPRVALTGPPAFLKSGAPPVTSRLSLGALRVDPASTPP